jgi:hypothetical protein
VAVTGSNEIITGAWIEDLIRQYRQHPPVPARPRRFTLTLTAVIAVGAALSPALLHLDHAAYPSDPKKQQALAACGRADQTFVRFFASDRAACYERFPGLVERATAAQTR